MIRRRTSRTLATLAVLAGMTATSVAVPGATLAHQPSWSMAVEAVPNTVSSGDTAAYLVTITNHGPRLSQLRLAARTPHGATLLQANPSQGTCQPSAWLGCSLGSLKKNRSVTVLVVYQAPSTGDDLEVSFKATSRRDVDDDDVFTLVRKGETDLIPSSDPDFKGRFVLEANQRLVANDQAIGGSNQHATRVLAPETGIPTWVDDVEGFIAGCGGSGGLPCFGAISEVHVNAGAVYPDGFKVIITFGVGELPLDDGPDHRSEHEPIEAEDLHLQHELDDGSTEIIPRCDDEDDRHGSETRLPCFEAWDLHDGSIRARVFLTENGLIQGW